MRKQLALHRPGVVPAHGKKDNDAHNYSGNEVPGNILSNREPVTNGQNYCYQREH